MLICPAISDTDHVQPRRNNHGSQLSGNIMDEAMRPFRRPMMTPVLPQFAAQHQVLAGIWVGSAIRADWGSNGMPIHSSLLDAEKAQARVPIHS
jgi:hypothetical protein